MTYHDAQLTKFLSPCQFMFDIYDFMYTRDVKLSFPNNNIKKSHTLNFYPLSLCQSFDQFLGEWPIYILE